MKKFLTTILLSFTVIGGVFAQSAVNVSTQVTSEDAIESGKSYVLQSQAAGLPYIADAGTYYSVPNSGSTATEACVYEFISNGDGTWKIKSKYTEKYWGVPVNGQDLMPADEASAGAWSLNFSSGIAYPTAPDAGGTTRGLDRSSQKLWGYTTGTGVTKQVKIYQLSDTPPVSLSDEILEELNGKTISVAENPANNLTTGQWYVMFDRGYTSGKPHGYLYENVSKHTLYNTATVPSGTTMTAAKYLVRLSDAENGKYYVQTGYGNYFGTFVEKTNVSVTSTPTEAITIAKIVNTDGHFYLQSTTSNVILDANDVGGGDATVVGWGKTVPTATGGNNDWAFYPVSFEDIGDDIALLAENVTVTRGYQTCGRGNENSLMLRIDLEPFQNMTDATITVKLNSTTQANINSLYVYETEATEFIANIPASPIATASSIGATTTIELGAVKAGTHHFWLCATVKDDAKLGVILDASLTDINYTCNGESQSLNVASRGKLSRQGMKVFDQQNFVFKPTSDNCRFYRIPAMILDKEDNIVVSIDKRYDSNADLGNHKIDVISMRSEDGGRTWKDKVDVATGDNYTMAYFGYGDPSLAKAENGDLICLMAAGSKRWGSN
ncbi:MAG: exo-alpha-sialidase, partial [Prevotella sp.]|nr:exo-alpha-sialidase [Prevotella sp.]